MFCKYVTSKKGFDVFMQLFVFFIHFFVLLKVYDDISIVSFLFFEKGYRPSVKVFISLVCTHFN